MLAASGSFKPAAIDHQIEVVKSFVEEVPVDGAFEANDWEGALVALAKTAGVKRVITDHPDLLAKESSGDVEFISSDAWLVEQAMPPPPPPPPGG